MDLEILCNIMNFAMGMLTMYLLQLAWVRYHNKRDGKRLSLKFNRRAALAVATGLIVFGAVFTGWQSYQTDQTVRDLTLQTQECYRQFAEAINARAKIAGENDQLSRKQRDALARSQTALYKLIATMISPEAIALTPEARRELNLRATREFNTVLSDSNRIVAEASAEEVANDLERQQHPLPQPDCGLE